MQWFYLKHFLENHKSIKNIVDVGCNDARVSLEIQKFIKDYGFADVRIFPVDPYTPKSESKLPMNILGAQEIIGANAEDTMFLCMNACTNESVYRMPSQNTTGAADPYFITMLIKNNPGCFVLASESTCSQSQPNEWIPAELCDSKFIQCYCLASHKKTAVTVPCVFAGVEKTLNHFLNVILDDRGRYRKFIIKIKQLVKSLRQDKVLKIMKGEITSEEILTALELDEQASNWVRKLKLTDAEMEGMVNGVTKDFACEREGYYFDLYCRILYELPYNQIRRDLYTLSSLSLVFGCWHCYRCEVDD